MISNISSLTTAEEQLMLVVWDLGDFRLRDVLDNYPAPVPHQNTVSTYLKILVDKGFLGFRREGRIFVYSVLIPKNVYVEKLVSDIIGNYFSSSLDFEEFLRGCGFLSSGDGLCSGLDFPIADSVLGELSGVVSKGKKKGGKGKKGKKKGEGKKKRLG